MKLAQLLIVQENKPLILPSVGKTMCNRPSKEGMTELSRGPRFFTAKSTTSYSAVST